LLIPAVCLAVSGVARGLPAAAAVFEIPDEIWFVEKFPMTVTGKVRQVWMRKMAQEQFKAKPTRRVRAWPP
jgi:acyl-coenzyme A synthetase/AMP-(fatty) acid ligase